MDKKMRICFVGSATSVHTQRWLKYFVDRGHQVFLISRHVKDIPGVKCYFPKIPKNLPMKKYLGNLIYWRFITRALDEIKPEIINTLSLFPYSVFAVYASVPKKIPIVVSPWGSDVLVQAKKNFIFRYFAKRCFQRANLIQVDSKSVMNTALKIGAPKKKTFLIYIPGVDTNEFRKSKETIPHSIISTRTFAPVYDVATTIRAFSEISKIFPEAILYLAGDGPLKTQLKELATSLDIGNKIRWLGKIPHKELKGYLGRAEVYISSSLSDSTPLSLLEAMSSSLPAVISDVQANMEWVRNDYNGFIFKKGDYKTAASFVANLLKDKKKRNLFGERSRKIVVERADYKGEFKEFEDMCISLIK